MDKIAEQLVKKSIEAFSLAIELYNKPTIHYRSEGFCSFIVNAWELMIKAHMINKFGEDSIYFKDNPDRTLSISTCIDKVFTNVKDPLSMNLKRIVELRNTSTHFVTKEYDIIYAPLFQACILNYVEKMQTFHGVDVTEYVPDNFLALPISIKAVDEQTIRAAYSKKVADRLFHIAHEIGEASDKEGSKFAIKIIHNYFLTKKKEEASEIVYLDKNSDSQGIRIIKEKVDPNSTHKHRVKDCVEQIKKRIKKNKIQLFYKGNPTTFNQTHFVNFCKYYNLKEDPQYGYKHEQFKQYTYSQQAIEFIYERLEENPNDILNVIAVKRDGR